MVVRDLHTGSHDPMKHPRGAGHVMACGQPLGLLGLESQDRKDHRCAYGGRANTSSRVQFGTACSIRVTYLDVLLREAKCQYLAFFASGTEGLFGEI